MSHSASLLKPVLLGLALAGMGVQPVMAADSLRPGQLQFQPGVKTSTTLELAHMAKDGTRREAQTLNWQTPSIELNFDLPPNERTSDIVLNLSADPLGPVNTSVPLQVSLNGGTPVPVRSRGRGFEASIPLEAVRARPRRNRLTISFPAASGAGCVHPAQGAWSVDLANSTLSLKGRTRQRNLHLRDVVTRLAQPALAPQRVGLIATGPNATQMQALAAQGIGLRTQAVPRFSISASRTDFNVVMVRRDELYKHTQEPMILNSKGARVFASRARPTDLIFTADTDAEILATLEAFSQRELPSVMRSITSVGEMNFQARLNSDIERVEKQVRLHGLDTGSYSFRVDNPATTSGALTLRLNTSDTVAADSRLRVVLNGTSLGAAKLDARRKTVAFEIAPGQLNATKNVLSVEPELSVANNFTCPLAYDDAPSVIIAKGSKLKLATTAPVSLTDTAHLAASGGVFADSPSYIALPRERTAFETSLRIVAQMARASGEGLTEATFSRKMDAPENGDMLVIGPRHMQRTILGQDFGTGAPKALREALTTRRIGGVVAQYQTADNRIIGVISAAPGDGFTRAAARLVEPEIWNALEGGVSRFDRTGVQMVQIAKPVSRKTEPTRWANLDLPRFEGLSLPEWSMPDVNWPTVSLPAFTRPEFSLPKWTTSKALPPVAESPVIAVPVPTAKPVQTVEYVPTEPLRLRGAFSLADLNNAESASRNAKQTLTTRYRKVERWTQSTWDSAKSAVTSFEFADLKGIGRKVDRLQDNMKPAGDKLRGSFAGDWPGKKILTIGDRTFTVFGLMLFLAFGLVLLLMSVAGPSSRLGGRH
jgi:hypothetical protein